jgi:hypothetical protein
VSLRPTAAPNHIINPFQIARPCRPRLKSRTTRTLTRMPWMRNSAGSDQMAVAYGMCMATRLRRRLMCIAAGVAVPRHRRGSTFHIAAWACLSQHENWRTRLASTYQRRRQRSHDCARLPCRTRSLSWQRSRDRRAQARHLRASRPHSRPMRKKPATDLRAGYRAQLRQEA